MPCKKAAHSSGKPFVYFQSGTTEGPRRRVRKEMTCSVPLRLCADAASACPPFAIDAKGGALCAGSTRAEGSNCRRRGETPLQGARAGNTPYLPPRALAAKLRIVPVEVGLLEPSLAT